MGFIAASLSTLVWMTISSTSYHEGDATFIPLGVGVLVGVAIRLGGAGTTAFFGVMGAVMTLLSCLVGQVFASVQLATGPGHDFYNVLTTIDLWQLAIGIINNISPIMYGVYAGSVVIAFMLSFRKAPPGL